MTLHCLVIEPPVPGRSLPALASNSLEPADAATLHEASIKDTMTAAARSGGELLVNYPAEGQLPDDALGATTPEAALRSMAEAALEDPDVVRYEVQVGDSFAARAGYAATHLLAEEGVDSVAVLRGTAPTVDRTVLDGAAMQLRRNEMVIGPGTGGRDAYLGLTEPIDFDGTFDPPEIQTLAERSVEADYSVAFLAHHPVIETEPGLASAVAEIRARERAGRAIPAHTAAVIDALGLSVVEDDGQRRIRAGTTDST